MTREGGGVFFTKLLFPSLNIWLALTPPHPPPLPPPPFVKGKPLLKVCLVAGSSLEMKTASFLLSPFRWELRVWNGWEHGVMWGPLQPGLLQGPLGLYLFIDSLDQHRGVLWDSFRKHLPPNFWPWLQVLKTASAPPPFNLDQLSGLARFFCFRDIPILLHITWHIRQLCKPGSLGVNGTGLGGCCHTYKEEVLSNGQWRTKEREMHRG